MQVSSHSTACWQRHQALMCSQVQAWPMRKRLDAGRCRYPETPGSARRRRKETNIDLPHLAPLPLALAKDCLLLLLHSRLGSSHVAVAVTQQVLPEGGAALTLVGADLWGRKVPSHRHEARGQARRALVCLMPAAHSKSN